MEISIVGTGNVATILAKLMLQSGHTIREIIGRDVAKTNLLAAAVNADAQTDFTLMYPHADLYIIAVSDKAIASVAHQFSLPLNGVVVHTAGSVTKEVLRGVTHHYGVLYPLQSLRKEVDVLPSIPFFVDANDDDTLQLLISFTKTLSPAVAVANDEVRQQLHIAAVIVSNFTNYLYSIAYDYCQERQIDFTCLLPLIQETAQRLQHHTPAMTMTGPAFRKDISTIGQHYAMLQATPDIEAIYKYLSEKIMEMKKS